MVTGSKSMQINMRIRPAQRELIARAAELHHKSVSEFVIDAATEAAEDTLLKQRVYLVEDEQYKQILRIMDSPVSDNPTLQQTLDSPAPWEQ
jgi:uncharacterized protein (DUF1778 family)